jgi:branched-chain amino acid transport system substrate-binding protein
MEEQKAPSAMAAAPARKNTALYVAIAVLVVIVLVVTAAAYAGVFTPAKPAPAALKIGTLLSLTGALSQYGPGDTKGARLAQEQINAAGGVLGQPISIVTEDDQTNPTAAAGATTKLVTQDHVNAIVGAQFSGGTIASISIAKTAGVPMVSPSATSPALSNLSLTGGYFFRTAPSDALQGVVAANYLYNNLSLRYINLMARDDSYGRGLVGVINTRFTTLGGHVNTTVIINPAGTNFDTDLATLFSTNPQLVYLAAFPGESLILMSNWQAALSSHPTYNRPWVFSEGEQSQAFMDQLRSAGVDVTKIRGTAPVSPFGAIHDIFVSQYLAAFNNATPVLYSDYTYDCVYLIALAAQQAGTVDGKAIRDHLQAVSGPNGTVIKPGDWAKALTEIAAGHQINWEGAAGSENFDANGDVRGSYEIWGVNSTYQIYRIAFIPDSIITTSSLHISSLLGSQLGSLSLRVQVVGVASRP